jgi:hypothetical protein
MTENQRAVAGLSGGFGAFCVLVLGMSLFHSSAPAVPQQTKPSHPAPTAIASPAAAPKFECRDDGTPLSPEKQAACVAWAMHADSGVPQPDLTKAQEDEIDRNDPCYQNEVPVDHMNCMLRYFQDRPGH